MAIASDSPPPSQAHARSLDGLRFFAFFGVFAFHALQNNAAIGQLAAYGALGVQVFFVLSGFLIGGILLDLKKETGVPLGTSLRIFYVRRALRIFPLYYMTLLVLLAVELGGFTLLGGKDYFVWNATYLTNFKMYVDREMPGALSHFWTLSVEEQFYLITPLVLLTLSIRKASLWFVVLWVGSIITRVLLRHDSMAYLLSPLQFECMTVGIVAAMLQRGSTFLGVGRAKAMRLALVCSIAVVPLFALRYTPWAITQAISAGISYWVFSVAVAGLILLLWNSQLPRLNRLLSAGPLPYLGKISYGLYVFHFPCLLLCYVWFGAIMPTGTAIPAFAMTVAVAALSWHLVERPINDLKRYFPYQRARGTGAGSQPQA